MSTNVTATTDNLVKLIASITSPSEGFKYTRKYHWIFSLTAVTIINICAINGIFLYPMLRFSRFRIVLILLMAFAVGVLSGNGFVHLIPAGFKLDDDPKDKSYVIYSSVILIGLISFSFFETLIKLFTLFRSTKDGLIDAHINNHGLGHEHVPPIELNETNISSKNNFDGEIAEENNPESDLTKKKKHNSRSKRFYSPICFYNHILPYAALIIIGDAFHNFVDGLLIGAAFSQDLSSGISNSLAVLSEEFPHELGDFAALLTAGLTIWQALFWNFVSSLFCYLGCLIGLIFGELKNFARVVELMCAGVFLYISFCGMLPEIMIEVQQVANRKFKKYVMLVLLCYLMILFGMATMVGMAYVEIKISV